MANITAAMVKELRDKTGAGMMDCKSALQECDGDYEAASDWLRKKGHSKADKKASRVASEGLVAIALSNEGSGGAAAIIEVNSETDFVARNAQFQELVKAISDLALEVGGDFDALQNKDVPGTGANVSDHVKDTVGILGENLSLRRSAGLQAEQGVVAGYVHNQLAAGQGKIGVIVTLSSAGDAAKLEALGKQIAMHIAASNPQAINQDSLDPALVEKERAVLLDQARESGKPEDIIEKMVEGRLRKFYAEVVLLSQIFVIDGENTIEKVLRNAESDVGAPVEIAGFVRYELGEGIEKKP